MVEVFTPQKSANATNQDFFERESRMLNIYQYTTEYKPSVPRSPNISKEARKSDIFVNTLNF